MPARPGRETLATLDALDALEAPDAPVVLSGTLLTADTPVRRDVLTTLQTRGTRVTTATDPALGAARLAARSTTPA